MTYKPGDIVQIVDEKHHWFPVLLVVTEDKGWGIMGYHIVCTNSDEPNGQAYIRIKNEQIELVGRAVILRADEVEREDAPSMEGKEDDNDEPLQSIEFLR